MATEINVTRMTLLDWVNRRDPSGGVAKIVERLQKTNPILQELPIVEGNLDTGEQITSRVALPSPSYRRINQGVDPAKSVTEQFIEPCALLESRSEIDVEHPGLKAGGAAFRASEDAAFVQGFNNEIATGIFYNSQVTALEKFHGLTPRLNALSGLDASGQIVNSDASADGTIYSIWLLGLSPETVYGFFPKGTMGGFEMEDLGRQYVRDRDSKEFLAWVTRFVWRFGLAVKDYRYVVRIANIDDSDELANVASGTINIANKMSLAMEYLYSADGVQPVWYMNRRVFGLFNAQLMAKSVNLLEYVERNGRRIPHYLGIPIHVVDALVAESLAS